MEGPGETLADTPATTFGLRIVTWRIRLPQRTHRKPVLAFDDGQVVGRGDVDGGGIELSARGTFCRVETEVGEGEEVVCRQRCASRVTTHSLGGAGICHTTILNSRVDSTYAVRPCSLEAQRSPR